MSLNIVSGSVVPASSGPVRRGRPRPAAGLGKSVKTVDSTSARKLRAARFSAKLTAANCLKGHDEKLAHRLRSCCRVAHAESVELVAQSRRNGDKTAILRGLVTCKSVWSCPVCSARISAQRKDELNRLLAWARGEGHAVVMLTLTARHGRATVLPDFLEAMKVAGRRLRQSRKWRSLGLVGSVAAQEVTHGGNGWHVHGHWLLVLPCGADAALQAVEGLRAEWLRSLGKAGMTGGDAAFQVQSASAAGEYVGKFGAAEEVALGHVKKGRGGSRTPWQLLADARDGDAQAAALFRDYSLSFKGRRQLVWSPRLKDRAGINDVADDELPGEVVAETVVRAWRGSGEAWRSAAKRACALLDAAELGQDLDAAEVGPTDAERWRSELAASHVLE